MEQLQVNIFTTDLDWIGTVDAVQSLVHRTSWHEIANSELSVSKTAQGVEELQIGRILVINNQLDKALIIEDMATSLEDLYWNFVCIPLKGMLNYRVCHPLDSGDYFATKQAEVMMRIVEGNLVTQARDVNRKFPHSVSGINMLSIASIKTWGDFIDYTINWENGHIGDVLIDISKMYGKLAFYPLGWNVYIKSDFSGFMFDVWHGTHKHVNQTILSPVVFSEEFGNIKSASYEYSIKEWGNFVYSTYMTPEGQTNTPVKNEIHGATIGFKRKEFIIDSGKEVLAQATDVGYSELNKRPHVESFTAEIINNINTMSTYNSDWFLGDIVTIQSKAIIKNQLLSLDAQITEIEEIYDQGEYSINVTFGEGKLSLIQLVKNAINQK
jgi:hypothetical protein